ncbi:MAG: PTS sugar transporter subunit IIC, partial [Bacillota bacterium]
MEATANANFLVRKNVNITFKAYFIDAMGSMAFGLFASLLIGTILGTIGTELSQEWLVEIANFAKASVGAAMGASIATALVAPPLVMFSAITVGFAGNSLGGPVGAFIASIVAVEVGKLVSKETKIDIIVTPTVTIIIGVLVANVTGPFVSSIMTSIGTIINVSTELEPLLMGVIVAVVV